MVTLWIGESIVQCLILSEVAHKGTELASVGGSPASHAFQEER